MLPPRDYGYERAIAAMQAQRNRAANRKFPCLASPATLKAFDERLCAGTATMQSLADDVGCSRDHMAAVMQRYRRSRLVRVDSVTARERARQRRVV